jgi:hypothetical protein
LERRTYKEEEKSYFSSLERANRSNGANKSTHQNVKIDLKKKTSLQEKKTDH